MIEVGSQMSFRDRVEDEIDQLGYPLAVVVLSRLPKLGEETREKIRTDWVEAIADEARATGKVDWRAGLSLWILRREDRSLANAVITDAKNKYRAVERILNEAFPGGIQGLGMTEDN